MKRTWKKIGSLLLALCMVLTMLPMTALAADGDIDINETNFPDDNFRAWLQSQTYGSDHILTATEIAVVTSMDVSDKSISDLTGIEYFTALTELHCSDNNLTELPDLPAGLTGLDCSYNNLTALPVSLPANLTELDCSSNNLTVLPDLPDSLTRLSCAYNNLTELPDLPAGLTGLDCSGNNLTELPNLPDSLTILSFDGNNLTELPDLPAGLTWLGCSDNNLTELPDLPAGLTQLGCGGNNLTELPDLPDSLTMLHCQNNNLTALPALPDSLDSLDCSYNSLTELVLNSSAPLLYINVSYNNIPNEGAVTGKTITWNGTYFTFAPQKSPGDIVINAANFPDANFRAWLLDQHYGDDDDVLTPAEIAAVTNMYVQNKNISDLTGIEYFTALTVLLCDNNNLTALPALLPTGLTVLDCNMNSLTELPALPDGLTELYCYNNNLTELPSLPDGLTELDCNTNSLTELPALPAGLTRLYCYSNNLTELPATLPDSLTRLDCNNNSLTELPALPAGLTELDCNNNSLTELELNSSATYVFIYANGNYMTNTSDVTGPTINWRSADGGSGNAAFLFYPQKTVPVGDIVINAANFPDANFRTWLQNQTYGDDSVLTAAEIAAITTINVYDQSISDLTGIGYFTALTYLQCNRNNLTALPVLPDSLITLYCTNNSLTALPTSLPAGLTGLYCYNNNLTALPTTLPTGLTMLDCESNNLTALPELPDSLTALQCQYNNLTALPALPDSLTALQCHHNSLTELVLNSSVTYTVINVSYNNIPSTGAVTGKTITWDTGNFTFTPQRTPVTFTATQTGGTSGTANSTGIVLTFSETVTGLTADKITIANGTTGSATKGTLSGSGTTWTIALSGVSAEGDVTVSIADFGDFHVTNNPQAVEVYKEFTATITFNANGGSVSPTSALTGADGKLSSLPTPTRSGSYSFSGWFTLASGGTAVTTATEFTENTEIYAHWTYTGGSSSGGGGGTPVVTPPAPKTETTTSGNTATATTTATATIDNSGTATAAVTQAQVSDAIAKAAEAAAKQGGGTAAVVEIKLTAPANAKTVETSIPKAAMEQAADGNTAALTVSSPVASLSFDAAALATIAGEATGAVNISASIVDASTLSAETQQLIGDRPVFNFSVTSGGQTISQFGGSVSVSVPYSPKAGEDLNAIVIYYINAEGKPEVVSNCSYDPATGTISFKTDHFSQYAVGYNKVTFKDVAENAWYSKAVSFIAAREITTGTGNGNYSPDAKLTRGEFIVMLMKAYGIAPDTATADNFADAGNTYYTGYLAAAKRLGISGGVGNNMYAPGKEITRQEMFTLLYNALKAIGQLPEGNTGKSLSAFSDAGQVASWAKDAMILLVETGTVSGADGKLTPEETTTRAQMAQVLYNLMSE